MKRFLVCSTLPLLFANIASLSLGITITTVPVGDLGNPNDGGLTPYGGVAYAYDMAKFEVTTQQYTAFLNAVAATDTYALYNRDMDAVGNSRSIAQNGSSGSYTYSITGAPNRPITFVSWGDAARFANWMHNGQPTGPQNSSTTEDGAYTLNGATNSITLIDVVRNANAKWVIPTRNEWYKAAYYQPAAQGGDTDSYWLYPYKTNNEPYSDQPPGATPDNTRVGNFQKNDSIANGYDDGYAVTGSPVFNTGINYLSDVGAYTSSPSYYATFDQGGDVYEWSDTAANNIDRVVLGGSWNTGSSGMRASSGIPLGPGQETSDIGFRLVRVPEPASCLLLLSGIAVVFSTARVHGSTRRQPGNTLGSTACIRHRGLHGCRQLMS